MPSYKDIIFEYEHDFSFGPKCLLVAVLIFIIFISDKILFSDGYEVYNLSRRIILIFCQIIYLLRLLISGFVFLKRKITWREAIIVSIALPFIFLPVVHIGGASYQSINIIDIFGISLYLCGSYLNTYSEYSRYIWKKKKENTGRLYTQGLFKYSMHINYFGEVVLFLGFALIAHSIPVLLIPVIMALNFVCIIIPSLDEYLEEKYQKEFEEYAKQTKKLIPMIY